jgi:hypothetical protein
MYYYIMIFVNDFLPNNEFYGQMAELVYCT